MCCCCSSAFCPYYLQQKDVSQLLRLYLDYGLMDDALSLISSYIDAVLGQAREPFALQVCMMMDFFIFYQPLYT
jgi:hypothetical protein